MAFVVILFLKKRSLELRKMVKLKNEK